MKITKRIEEIVGEDAYNYGAFQADDNKMRFGYTPEELQKMLQLLKALFLEMSEEIIGEDEPYDSRIANTIYHRNDLRVIQRLKRDAMLGGEE